MLILYSFNCIAFSYLVGVTGPIQIVCSVCQFEMDWFCGGSNAPDFFPFIYNSLNPLMNRNVTDMGRWAIPLVIGAGNSMLLHFRAPEFRVITVITLPNHKTPKSKSLHRSNLLSGVFTLTRHKRQYSALKL